jgi:alkylation response protein AidB-like acyl-CoA dehydrogenase
MTAQILSRVSLGSFDRTSLTSAAGVSVLHSRHQAVEAAQLLGARIQARVDAVEQDRCVAQETIKEVVDAGLFGIVTPRVFGGSELGFAALFDVAVTLASSCGSTGWVYGVLTSHNWLLSLFPVEAQREVFSDNTALTATVFRFGGKATKVEGGYRMQAGEGRFCSGIDHSQWVILGNAVQSDDGPPEPRYFLVPVSDVEIVDDWFTVGMRGTGSRTIRVADAFIPEHRSVAFGQILNGTSPGALFHESKLYRMAFNNAPPLALIGAPIGMARAALRVFSEALAQRCKGGSELELAAQSGVFSRLAQIGADIDSAYNLVLADAVWLDESSDITTRTAEQVEKVARDIAYAAQKCRVAVTSLFEMGGGSAIYEGSALQRLWRDVSSASNHFAFTWDNASVNYGRALLGLPTVKFAPKQK